MGAAKPERDPETRQITTWGDVEAYINTEVTLAEHVVIGDSRMKISIPPGAQIRITSCDPTMGTINFQSGDISVSVDTREIS